jgi:hypothetical protein
MYKRNAAASVFGGDILDTVKQIGDELSCPLCGDIYEKPVSLPVSLPLPSLFTSAPLPSPLHLLPFLCCPLLMPSSATVLTLLMFPLLPSLLLCALQLLFSLYTRFDFLVLLSSMPPPAVSAPLLLSLH